MRCFDNDNIVHVDGSVDPLRDKDTIDMELQLKDLETVDKKIDKVKRAAKTGNKEAQAEEAVLLKIKSALESGISVRAIEFDEESYDEYVKPLQCITDKPVMYVCNVDEAEFLLEQFLTGGLFSDFHNGLELSEKGNEEFLCCFQTAQSR